jgi:3-dehydroquinate synthase
MGYHYNEEGIEALNNWIEQNNPSKIFILTDNNTQKYCLPKIAHTIQPKFTNVNIKNGDEFKNVNTLNDIWESLMNHGADRKSLLINLGGGMITDIGGFAAATFKRGIKFIHVPTTLLGMVDAAIGGKNGINFNNIKNQIGTIVPPDMIWFDTEFLETLPKEEFDSGFAEMLKHGLINDANYWKDLLDYYKNPKNSDLNRLIKASVDIKHKIITQDPTEQNIRKLLNFGHTLGHAIESLWNYDKQIPLSHGKAVAIGMVLESYLSFKINGLDQRSLDEIKANLNQIYQPLNFSSSDIIKVLNLLQYDKKNEHGKILFVLLNQIGKADYNIEVPTEYIKESFQYYQS